MPLVILNLTTMYSVIVSHTTDLVNFAYPLLFRQVRSTQCKVRMGNVSKSADAQLCEEAGLTPPPTIQDCGIQECPQWSVGEWSSCKTQRCFTLHYGKGTKRCYYELLYKMGSLKNERMSLNI